MALSHHERRALELIAVEMSEQDPQLALSLARDGWIPRRKWQRMAAAAMFVTGMAMQACAIFVPPSITGGILAVSVLGYVVMFYAALLWCKAPQRHPRRPRYRRGGAGPRS
ncbi:DUF3040 domain-containing protein [Mycolicibacterium sphagni]|nr:DUF3040 domain-containing protein [Mycolicibacterium sphagni]